MSEEPFICTRFGAIFFFFFLMKSFSNRTFPTMLTVGRMWIAQMQLYVRQSIDKKKKKKQKASLLMEASFRTIHESNTLWKKNQIRFVLLRFFSIEQFLIFENHNSAQLNDAVVALGIWWTQSITIKYSSRWTSYAGMVATKIPST